MRRPFRISALVAIGAAIFMPALIVGRAGGGAQAPAPAGRGQPPGPGRGGRGRGAAAPADPRAAASVDITGYWTSVVAGDWPSVVTEDWRYRMATPPKGDRQNVPVTAAAIAVLNAWDPAKDEAAGEQCRAYGAVGAMRQPGRLHITWADDNTLKIDTEAGTQTRLLHFGAATASAE